MSDYRVRSVAIGGRIGGHASSACSSPPYGVPSVVALLVLCFQGAEMASVLPAAVALSPNSSQRRRLAQVAPSSPPAQSNMLRNEPETFEGSADESEAVRPKEVPGSRPGRDESAPGGVMPGLQRPSLPRYPEVIPDADRHAGSPISSNRSAGGTTAAARSDFATGEQPLSVEMTPEQEEALAAALLEEVGEQCDVLDGLVAEAEEARASGPDYDEDTDSEDADAESEMLEKLATTYARVDEQLRLLSQKLGTDEVSEAREAEQADVLSGADGDGANALRLRDGQLHNTREQSTSMLSSWMPGFCVLM